MLNTYRYVRTVKHDLYYRYIVGMNITLDCIHDEKKN